MKVTLLLLVTLIVLVSGHPVWEETEGSRMKRAVDLPTLRRLMNNIALSEYYRLRGLEVLGTLGGNASRPGALSSTASDDLEVSASTKAKSIFDFPIRSREFQQFFAGLSARRG